jgi:hypothetical protein
MLGDDYSLAKTLRIGSFSNTLFELLRLLQLMAKGKAWTRLDGYALAIAVVYV